jgi:hypothetical protein
VSVIGFDVVSIVCRGLRRRFEAAYLETLRPRTRTSIATTRTATTINKIHQIMECPQSVAIFLRQSMRSRGGRRDPAGG